MSLSKPALATLALLAASAADANKNEHIIEHIPANTRAITLPAHEFGMGARALIEEQNAKVGGVADDNNLRTPEPKGKWPHKDEKRHSETVWWVEEPRKRSKQPGVKIKN